MTTRGSEYSLSTVLYEIAMSMPNNGSSYAILRLLSLIISFMRSDDLCPRVGIIKDVIKLSDSCGINKKFYGVMLMFWADPKTKENLNLDTIRNSILMQTRKEKPGARTTRLESLTLQKCRHMFRFYAQ